jgi:Mg2+ and Co2+ transporter CorA
MEAALALPDADSGIRTFLYDADATDGNVSLRHIDVEQLTDRQLLWIDVSAFRDLQRAAVALGLAPETVGRISSTSAEPGLFVHDGYVHVIAVAPGKGEVGHEPVLLNCVVGPNWVLTAHQRPIDFLDHFDERIRGDSEFGRLNSHDFLAAILEEHVTSYFAELGPLEAELDRLDLKVMTGRVEEDALLRELVAMRMRLSRLRRLLVPHRELFAVLTRSEFRVLSGAESSVDFERLTELLERALQSMEVTREMIVGSFEIYTTWTAHGANKVMKLLTVVSVTLLPPTLLAGVMGMNSLPNALASSPVFWVTTTLMLGLGVATLAFARARDWV